MNKSKIVTVAVAGALTFVIARGAVAFGGGRRGGLFGGPRLLHALDLNADQKQQVKAIWRAHRTALAPLIANEKAAREALADKLAAPGPVTANDLAPLIQNEAQARTALTQARLAAVVDVRNVLTPAQIQKAATIRAGMKQLHAQMRELLGRQGAAD